ncbi:glycosyltransferase family 4 protein [Leucobacter aridicollis]|uniref:glycosyltransferase family 4 protein n=1 Tax=Leucobacter aridicollis TaxID=283878 RepID=UPI0013C53783|nr:glycosyltransferase family 4 protein [Leucobacter aridicollis]UTX52781.1 hypothetical protein KI794_13830 [Leucobacter aridicollis]
MGTARASVWGRLRNWLVLARLRQRGVGFPDVAPPDSARSRVFIGPANSAGQAYRWARALEEAHPEFTVTSAQFGTTNPFAFPVDMHTHLGYAAASLTWQQRQLAALGGYRAVLIESNRSVLAGSGSNTVPAEVERLTAQGVQVGLVFHGSDIRDPAAHMRTEPDSFFAVDSDLTAALVETTARSRRTLARTNCRVFVSTVDLLSDIPNATWLPVVISPEVWATTTPPLAHGGVPRVVHVPSSSVIKGTDLIEPKLRALHEQGIIDFVSVRGVSHEAMVDLYRGADVVLDQFRGGPYGVAACEAMAAGRILISHVPDRHRLLELTGAELPIIEATHETLVTVLGQTLSDPVEAQRVAALGPDYVRRIHDGSWSGRVLADWLDEGKTA